MRKKEKINKPINLGLQPLNRNPLEAIESGDIANLPLGYVSCVGKTCVECIHVWDALLQKYTILCRVFTLVKEIWL